MVTKSFHFNAPITVRTDRGDLHGRLVGLDETGTLARVTIDRDNAPIWFRDAHTSRCPQVWVSRKDVEER